MEYALYIIVSIIIILVVISKTPIFKGFVGETRVKFRLGKSNKDKYVLNNVKFKIDGKSTQIDHIVINRNGIFVIETKNLSGRIYGNDTKKEWTQVLKYGKVKNKFYSPVKQNANHIYNLKQIVGDNYPFKSIVVFVKGNVKYIESNNVYSLYRFKKILNKKIGDTYLTKEDRKKIYDLIEITVKEKNVTTIEHIRNINKMKNNIDNNICPRCGSNLTLKHSEYGPFFGCSNYPNCRFIKK